MTAIQATFADFKVIKGRKVAQLVMEVPLEGANHALQALGGVPQPQSEQWVGIAPIAAQERPEPEKKPMSLAQKAGMLCQTPLFWDFCVEQCNAAQADTPHATAAVRYLCGVVSRSNIKEGTAAGDKFKAIMADYDAWRGAIPEQR